MKQLFMLLLLLPTLGVAQQNMSRWQTSFSAGVAIPLGVTAERNNTLIALSSPVTNDTQQRCCNYAQAGYATTGLNFQFDVQYQLMGKVGLQLTLGYINQQRDMQEVTKYFNSLWPSENRFRGVGSDANSMYVAIGPSLRKSFGKFSLGLTGQLGIIQQTLPLYTFEEYVKPPLFEEYFWFKQFDTPSYQDEEWYGGSSRINKRHMLTLLSTVTLSTDYEVLQNFSLGVFLQYQHSTFRDQLRYVRADYLSGPTYEQIFDVKHRLLNTGLTLAYRW